jgi:enolase
MKEIIHLRNSLQRWQAKKEKIVKEVSKKEEVVAQNLMGLNPMQQNLIAQSIRVLKRIFLTKTKDRSIEHDLEP